MTYSADWMRRARALELGPHLAVGLSTGAARGATLVVAILAARLLGPAEFGVYTMALVVYGVLLQLTATLDAAAVVLYRAGTHAERDVRRLHAGSRLLLAGAISLVGAALWVWPTGRSGLLAAAAWGTWICAAQALLGVVLSRLRSFERFGRFAVVTALGALVPLLVAGACLADGRCGLTPLVAAFVVAPFVAALGAGAEALRSYRIGARQRPPGSTLRGHVTGLLGGLLPATLLYLLFQRADYFVLSRVASAETLGHYGVALRFNVVVGILGSTIPLVLYSRAVDPGTWTDPARRRSYRREAGAILALCAVATVLLVALAPRIIALVFGPDYLPATSSSRLLAVAGLAQLAPMPWYFRLYAFRRHGAVLGLAAAQLLIAYPAALVGVRAAGTSGAAAGMIATYVVGGLLLLVLGRGTAEDGAR